MANINIEIPDDLYKQVKLAAIMKDMTVKSYVIQKIDEGLRRRKQ